MQNLISIRRRGWSGRIPSFPLQCFFVLFGPFVTRTAGRTNGPILTIYASHDVFPRKNVSFAGFFPGYNSLQGLVVSEQRCRWSGSWQGGTTSSTEWSLRMLESVDCWVLTSWAPAAQPPHPIMHRGSESTSADSRSNFPWHCSRVIQVDNRHEAYYSINPL